MKNQAALKFYFFFNKITPILQNCIGPTIRIGRESWCLPYAGFLLSVSLTH